METHKNNKLIDSPKDHRLFHYTSEFGNLVKMLEDGLWARYSAEDLSWLFDSDSYSQTFVAIPMVCFCDIPVHAAGDHRDKYGNYAIAIHKNYTEELNVNPIWYFDQNSSVTKEHQQAYSTMQHDDLNSLPLFLKKNLAYFKSTIGTQRYRGDYNREGVTPYECMAFDEELEWRYIPSALDNTWLIGSDLSDQLTEELHAKSLEHKIKLSDTMIDTIIVPSQAEVDKLRDQFPNQKFHFQTWESIL